MDVIKKFYIKEVIQISPLRISDSGNVTDAIVNGGLCTPLHYHISSPILFFV